MEKKGRIFSGMRPTADRPHLGNMLGALSNWVKLQDDYECYFGIVDWHALTTAYADPRKIKENIRQMAIDWISAGIDPAKSPIFVQSAVKEHAELHLLLSMITPVPWLERCPTYKDQLIQLKEKDLNTYGFLGYPVLMAADILVYRADSVPVGEDQLPHLELAREIARRFNNFYGPIFPEPQALLSKTPLLPGIDGRKMSKSYNNYIAMSASPDEIRTKVRAMITDPQRIKKTDPGNPDICTVYAYYKIFAEEILPEVAEPCRRGEIGCVACKKRMAEILVEALADVRARRAELEKDVDRVDAILEEGAAKARRLARETMDQVRKAMGI